MIFFNGPLDRGLEDFDGREVELAGRHQHGRAFSVSRVNLECHKPRSDQFNLGFDPIPPRVPLVSVTATNSYPEENLGIIVWLIIGLIAGFIARALVPGSDSMGVVGTLVLGLIGSLVGGFLGNLFVNGQMDIQAAGIIGSIIGAILALLIYRAMGRRV